MQRLLMLGASGKTGGHALRYALEKGLEVVALVRDPSKLEARPGLTVRKGTPAALEDVQRAIPGCSAVLSFLGHERALFPAFLPHPTPPRLMTTAIVNTVQAMKEHGLRRVVILSAAGVGDSVWAVPPIWKLIMRHTNIKIVYADHEAQEKVLAESGLDWTAVRAVALLGDKVGRTRISYDGALRPSRAISRAQTATFMVDCLLHPEFFRKAPVASTE
jgi:uncharacterized protein YbjT (DUF2867 family)